MDIIIAVGTITLLASFGLDVLSTIFREIWKFSVSSLGLSLSFLARTISSFYVLSIEWEIENSEKEGKAGNLSLRLGPGPPLRATEYT